MTILIFIKILKIELFFPSIDSSQSSSSDMVFSARSFLSSIATTAWILHYGVTSHIVNTSSLFTESKPLHNVYVTLPDHSQVLVYSIGDIHLNNFLILRSVLYIPLFRVNLI